jgi:hypothetical protein
MAQLDPIFANDPSTRNAVQMVDGIFAALSRPAFQRQPDWLHKEIAGLEGDIEGWQETITSNEEQIPKMQLEVLQCRLNVALAELRIHDLRTKLAAKTGGAA